MAAKVPEFLYDDCVACGICVQACPVSCIVLSKIDIDSYKTAYPELSERACIGCAQCEKSCPMNAIHMKAAL
jgi:formate hydrogenlyase subunit 6/NADH:ubiquinone oxidoreductase subunit I